MAIDTLVAPHPVTAISGERELRTATISSGGSLSGAVDLGTLTAACIVMSAAWTAADLTFEVSADGSTYVDLYDSIGNEYTVTAAASEALLLDIKDFTPFRYVKVRSGTSGTPVNQGADRSLTIICIK